jgi:hypothetical protein
MFRPSIVATRKETDLKTYDERLAAAHDRLNKLVGQRALKQDQEQRARRAAMAASIDGWLADLSEAERMKFFAGIEGKASDRNRKLIERHPDRPAKTPKASTEPTN